jgi:two-component system OmpR family response regulator
MIFCTSRPIVGSAFAREADTSLKEVEVVFNKPSAGSGSPANRPQGGKGIQLRLLLVEDDRAIGTAVRDHLAADGHAIDWARTLGEASAFVETADYALILLDLHLPDGDGMGLLRQMRQRGDQTHVVILTARDQISQRIEGLNAGADDYIVKPFDLGELSARIHAVSRRQGASREPVFKAGKVEIVSAERLARHDGVPVEITAREWAVLDCLLRRSTAVVSKPQLEHALYEFGAEIESNAVEVYVSRLRKKLGRDFITTVRGVGYRVSTR